MSGPQVDQAGHYKHYALRKHIVGELEYYFSKSVFECFFPWFVEELAA